MTRVQWPVPLDKNYYALSYRIVEAGGKTTLSIQELSEAIRAAGQAVRNVVWTGWSMFHQFTRPEIAPRVVIDNSSGEEVEAWETTLLSERMLEATLPDVWRITVDGRASLWRAYREDRQDVPFLAERGLSVGKYLSPRILVRELYELATHAKELARFFPYASQVEFRCSWVGLRNRKIADMNPSINWDERVSHVDSRISTATVSVDALRADTALVVEALAAPVLHLFDGLDLSRDWILKQVPTFREL